MFFYAQLDADGRCCAVSRFGRPLPEGPQFVQLDVYDESLLGRRYVDGQWT